jgi:ATP-dependent Clp protease protease subunit
MKGQASDIKIHADRIIKIRDSLNTIISERTGQPMEKVEKDTDRDNFMTSEEAKSYGIIDDIIARRK